MVACTSCHHCLTGAGFDVPAAALLGVNKDALEHALTTRSRVMREGVIVSPLNVRAAQDNRSVADRADRELPAVSAVRHPWCW